MPLPLAVLAAMYGPAAIAGIGAAAKGLSGGRGQRILQGGINTLNKLGQSPFMQNLANRFQFGYDPAAKGINKALNYPQNLAWTPGGLSPSNPIAYERGYQDVIEDVGTIPEIASDIKGFVVDLFKSEKTKEKEKKEKKKKERTESRKKQRIKEKKKEKSFQAKLGHTIPEHDADGGLVGMNKGGDAKKKKKGYAKKQRKRKHYRASGFVKMKKKKKYIT